MAKTQLYKFNAEHISRQRAVKLVRELEDKGVEVDFASGSQVFENELIMVVTCTAAGAEKVRDRVWQENNGACCDMEIITADALEALY